MAFSTQAEEIVHAPAPTAYINVELTQVPTVSSKHEDPFLVAFAEHYDPENPLDWRSGKKWVVTDVLSATGFIRIMVSTIMAPALTTIAAELHMNSTESAMALSIYLLATAVGPLVIGPLSEVYGRQRVLHASSIWFLAWNLACGFATTKSVLIASRFMAGFGASAIYSLAGGVLGDIWRPEQRGRSLGMYLLIPLLGSAVGPIIGGFMAGRTTWRWMFWATSAFQAVMIIASVSVFRETYAPFILKRRAQKLRNTTGDDRYQTAVERLDKDRSAATVVARSLMRPIRLLATHPIIQITSILSAFEYALLYIVLSTFSDLWITQYGESVEISGLHYIACALGEVVGSQLGGPILDWYWARHKKNHGGGDLAFQPSPESRMPLVLPGALLYPFGFLLYGWAAQYKLPWYVVDIGVFICMFSDQIQGMPRQAYVMDAYSGQYMSSALSASQFMRSLLAFLFPLFAPEMYSNLGYGWGNSLLAGLALVVNVPGPLFVWRYGERLRAKAHLT